MWKRSVHIIILRSISLARGVRTHGVEEAERLLGKRSSRAWGRWDGRTQLGDDREEQTTLELVCKEFLLRREAAG